MRKRQRTDDHENTDRWLVSYADFITLMFAFFTTMYAISHVDMGKLERFTGSMRSAFKATMPAEKSRISVIEGIRPINYSDVSLEKELRSIIERSGKIEGVTISTDERGVLVSFSDSVLFESGSAGLRAAAGPLLQSMGSVIKRIPNRVIIEGHTDNMPIKTDKYSSNWELSTARATSVLMFLLNDHSLDPSRFSAAGYGEYRPVAANAAPEGRSKNRRVDLVLESKQNGR